MRKYYKMNCKGCCFLDLSRPIGFFRRCSSRTKNRKIVLLLVGLDNAGKSSTAKGLAREPIDTVVPTVGFNSVKLKHRGFSVVIYDLGGSSQIRGIWHRYYGDVHGVIFVVDASDLNRIDESRKVLEQLLAHEKLSGKPMLLLANKQDRDGALDDLDIVERLNLELLVNKQKCPTMVQTCSAGGSSVETKQKLDPGILSGYRWLMRRIISDYESINSRVVLDCAEQKVTIEAARQQWRNKTSQEELRSEVNGNPFKPIHSLLEIEQNGYGPPSRESGCSSRQVDSDSPDSSSHTVGGGDQYIPLHSPSTGAKSDVLVVSEPQPLDVVIAVKEQFQWKMHKQKRHKFKLLQRTNRTAPASARSGAGDKVLPPLKGHPNSCSWARPSTTKSLPPTGWDLHHSLEQVFPPPESSELSIVVLKSARTLESSESDQEDVVCATRPSTK